MLLVTQNISREDNVGATHGGEGIPSYLAIHARSIHGIYIAMLEAAVRRDNSSQLYHLQFKQSQSEITYL